MFFFIPTKKAQDVRREEVAAGIYGFSGGEKTSSFIFGRNIACVEILP